MTRTLIYIIAQMHTIFVGCFKIGVMIINHEHV